MFKQKQKDIKEAGNITVIQTPWFLIDYIGEVFLLSVWLRHGQVPYFPLVKPTGPWPTTHAAPAMAYYGLTFTLSLAVVNP